MDTPEYLIESIHDNWDSFAPIAYLMYLANGRGALRLNIARGSERGQGFSQSGYVSEEKPDYFKLDDKAKEFIRIYDPEKELVAVISLPENQVGTALLRPRESQKTPKELYDSESNWPDEIHD